MSGIRTWTWFFSRLREPEPHFHWIIQGEPGPSRTTAPEAQGTHFRCAKSGNVFFSSTLKASRVQIRSFSDSKSLHPAAWPTGRGSGSASAVSQNFGSTFLLWVTKFGGLEENFCQSLVPQTGHLGPHGPTDFDRKVCSRSQLRRFPPGEVMSGQERDRGPRWGRGSILQTGPVCQVGSDHWSSE